MLILKRKRNQRIRIGDDVVIEVLGIGEQQVTLGITAPKSVSVMRTELEQAAPNLKPLLTRRGAPPVSQ